MAMLSPTGNHSASRACLRSLLCAFLLANSGCDDVEIKDPYARACGSELESNNQRVPTGYVCPAGKYCNANYSCTNLSSTGSSSTSWLFGQARCGNGLCESNENQLSCASDCAQLKLNESVAVGDLTRTYSVYIPSCWYANRTGTIPAVFALHGGGQKVLTSYALSYSMGVDPETSPDEGIGKLNRSAEQHCFIAVYPNAKVDPKWLPGKQFWNPGLHNRKTPQNKDIDDVAFISTLIDKLKAQYNVDSKRVFVTGISNGAQMAHRLACELSDKIAAIAPVASGIVYAPCSPKRAVPILQIHGALDPGWPYFGGDSCLIDDSPYPIQYAINTWKIINSCKEDSTVTYEHGSARCVTYSACKSLSQNQRADVTLCTLFDGGHTWPGGRTSDEENQFVWDSTCALGSGIGMNGVSQSLNAVDYMIGFFFQHPMP